jgi:hypothetical protein
MSPAFLSKEPITIKNKTPNRVRCSKNFSNTVPVVGVTGTTFSRKLSILYGTVLPIPNLSYLLLQIFCIAEFGENGIFNFTIWGLKPILWL